MGLFGNIFGSKKQKQTAHQSVKLSVRNSGGAGWFQPAGPKTNLNKHEHKKLEKQFKKAKGESKKSSEDAEEAGMTHSEFLALPIWNTNPLVPRVLELVRPSLNNTVYKDIDLTKETFTSKDYALVYQKLRNYQPVTDKIQTAFELLDSDGDEKINIDDLTRFFFLTTGLSEDAALYHAASILETAGRTELSFGDFQEMVPMLNMFAKFDLPPI